AQPPASAVVAGTLYAVTDEANALERSTGSVWEAYAPTGGGGGAPAAHHATHENGGTEELSGAGLSGALPDAQPPLIGPRAVQARAGNDPRLTDARVPTMHHTTHEPGGSDPLVNAAWTNQANTFTVEQTIAVTTGRLNLVSTNQVADAKNWRILSGNTL